MLADGDATLFAGILARIARNVLGALDHRMYARHMRHAGIAVELIVGKVAMAQQVLRDRAAFLRGLDLLATVLGRKHTLAKRVERGLELVLGLAGIRRIGVAQVFGNRHARDTAFDHGGARLFDARDIARDIHAGHACRALLVAHRDIAATFGVVDHLAPGHREQLAHGRQAHGHADGIDIKVFLGTGNNLPMRVDLADRHAGHAVVALGGHHGMRQVERHAAAGNLGRMHAIAAHARRSIDECDHVAARLQELERHDQANVARTDHEHAVARLYAVQVHHGLRGTGANHAGQRPTGKVERVLGRARSDQDGIALHMAHDIAHTHHDLAALVQANHRGVEHYVDARRIRLGEQLIANAKTADLGAMLLGAKEFVNLLEQLTAGAGVLVKHDDVEPALGGFDGSGKAAGAGADHDQIMTLHATRPPLRQQGSRRLRPPEPRRAGHPNRAGRRRPVCARPYRRRAASCTYVRWACRPRP